MRSVVVVFPASMWAMMPMFLQRSNGTVLDTLFFRSSLRTSCSPTVLTELLIAFSGYLLALKLCALNIRFANCAVKSSQKHAVAETLPAIMGEGLVRLGHS